MLNRHAVGYTFLAAGVVLGLFGVWHVQTKLNKQNDAIRAEVRHRDLEQRFFAFRICLSSGASENDCRRVAHGAVLPVLTKAQTTKIAKLLGSDHAGALGPRGIQGLVGKAGLRGLQGRTGPQGQTGAAGATGPRGPRGFPGAQGARGLTGSRGSPGAAGRAGAQGPAGARGPVGAPGQTGARGPTGPAGPAGLACPTGFIPMLILVRGFPNTAIQLYACVKGIGQ